MTTEVVIEEYLKEKRAELVMALEEQGYKGAQLAKLFGTNPMTISRILSKKPEDYKAKWVNVNEY